MATILFHNHDAVAPFLGALLAACHDGRDRLDDAGEESGRRVLEAVQCAEDPIPGEPLCVSIEGRDAELARAVSESSPYVGPGDVTVVEGGAPVCPAFLRGLQAALGMCRARPTDFAFSVAAEIEAMILREKLRTLPRDKTQALEAWTASARKAGGRYVGFPLGQVPSRIGNRATIKAHVALDGETAARVPEAYGATLSQIETALGATKSANG